MKVCGKVRSASARHEVVVSTDGFDRALWIPPLNPGPGSSINGGEFLMLSLATCYCNNLLREARRFHVPVDSVEVVATAQYSGAGLAVGGISYRADIVSTASSATLAELLRVTDAVAEIHNTVRAGAPVRLDLSQPPRRRDIDRGTDP